MYLSLQQDLGTVMLKLPCVINYISLSPVDYLAICKPQPGELYMLKGSFIIAMLILNACDFHI